VVTGKTTNFLKTNTSLSLAHTLFKSFSKMISLSSILLIFKLTLLVVATVSIARSQSVNAT
jgi:hypothetical protein